jgi:two-component system response regulator (stage 0 sporulation protein A)
MVIEDLTAINSITKLVYANIAKEFETTQTRVERAIRNAIEITWCKGDIECINSLFTHELNKRRTRPSNAEFITMVANLLGAKNHDKRKTSLIA